MRYILVFSLIWFQMDGVFAADPAEDCQTALTSQPQPSNRDLSLFGASPDEIDLGRSFQVEDKFRSVRLPPAIRNQCNAGNCWIQQELALAETSFQIENPDKAPLALDADYLTWAHLRDETLRSIKNAKDVNEAVHIEIGGSHRRYEFLLGEYGVIPEGVWKHHDLGKAKNAIDRLTIELSWLSRILRENINLKEMSMAQAEDRVDQLLNHYFGSAPPKTFIWNGQQWAPGGFGLKYGLIAQRASWGSVQELKFPKIYVDERDMRRFQTMVALQLRKTQLPIRAAIR